MLPTPPPGLVDPLQAKNDEDFDATTDRIKKALAEFRESNTLKLTQDALATRAQCSRTTLNNRGWPIAQLKEIKKERRERKEQKKQRALVPQGKVLEQSREEKLDQALKMSRDEVQVWKLRFDDAQQQLTQTQNALRVMSEQVSALQSELKSLRSRMPTGEVVLFKPAAAKPTSPRPSRQLLLSK